MLDMVEALNVLHRRKFLSYIGLLYGCAGAGLGLSWAQDANPSTIDKQKPFVPKMRLGLVTYNLGRSWDLETLITNCELTGFEGVELRTTHAHKVELNLSAEQRRSVRERFEQSRVKLVSLGSTFDYHTPDQSALRRTIEATKQYMLLARDVGAEAIKVRPNALPPGVPEEKTLEQIGRSLRELGEFGEKIGIEVRLEVHGQGTSSLVRIKRIMEIADHPMVGVCWNSNPTDLEEGGLEVNFRRVQRWIRIVHMRDLCDPTYPYRQLFALLQKIGFTGFCLAEIPESCEPIRLMHYYRALWLSLQELAAHDLAGAGSKS